MKTTCLSKIQQEDNFKALCQMTTNMLQLEKGSLSSKSRNKELRLPRMVVSVVSNMIDETHYNVIANGISRDRTCINYYVNMHKSNYRTYPEYRDLFNKIYNSYAEIKDSKRTFEDMLHLRDHLRSNGVRNSENKQTTIRVKSGRVSVDVKLSFRDFSSQLELITLALTNCNYKLVIK